MRQYGGITGIANVKDRNVRHALYEIDRWIRQASLQVGILGPGTVSGGTSGASGTVGVINQVDELELINNATEGILSFGRGTDSLAYAIRVGTDGRLLANTEQLDGNTIDLGSGAAGSGTQRVILATDQPVIPVSDNEGSLTIDGTVDTELPTAVSHNDSLTLAAAPNVISATYARNAGGTSWSRISAELASAADLGQTTDRGLHVSDVLKYQANNFTGLNGDYDNSTSTRTSSNTQANTRFRKLGIFLEATRTGLPGGPLVIQVQYRTGSEWHDHRGPGGRMEFSNSEIGTSSTRLAWEIDILGDAQRLVVSTDSAGVDGSNYYTIASGTPTAVGVQKN